MSRRSYPVISIPVETGGMRCIHRIHCSTCDATNDQSAGRAEYATTPVPVLEKTWRTRGWFVSKSDGHDICPTCSSTRRKRHSNPQTAEIIPMPQNASPAPVTVEPRALGFMDRRIILAKLQEVYVDEKAGYAAGWTDTKVAADLGVPAEWVSTLRQENFGDAGDNSEIRNHIEQIQEIERECRALLDVLRQTVREQREKIDQFDRQCTGLSERLREIQRTSALLVKAVA
jgi:hypothetical protein